MNEEEKQKERENTFATVARKVTERMHNSFPKKRTFATASPFSDGRFLPQVSEIMADSTPELENHEQVARGEPFRSSQSTHKLGRLTAS